jgi:hypothetical protein
MSEDWEDPAVTEMKNSPPTWLTLLQIVALLALYGAIGFVVVHFVVKYW